MSKRNRRRNPPKKKGYEGGGLFTAGFHVMGWFLSHLLREENKNVHSVQETEDAEFEVIEPKKLTDGKDKRG